MTSVEIIDRLARKHRRLGGSALTVAEVQDALYAINLALQALYQALPVEYREKTVHVLVPAPRAVTLSATNGSATLGASAFTTGEVGRTVVSSGDDIWHRVADEDALAAAWLGSTGSHSATVYGDAVAGDGYPFERMLSAPVLLEGSRERELVQIRDLRDTYEPGTRIGEPRYYWLSPQGNSQGEEPLVLLRVLPIPDRAYRLRYRASFGPRRVKFTDVANAAPLPVPDNYAEALVSMCGIHLASFPGWNIDTRLAAEERATALRFVALNKTTLRASTNQVGTPAGY